MDRDNMGSAFHTRSVSMRGQRKQEPQWSVNALNDFYKKLKHAIFGGRNNEFLSVVHSYRVSGKSQRMTTVVTPFSSPAQCVQGEALTEVKGTKVIVGTEELEYWGNMRCAKCAKLFLPFGRAWWLEFIQKQQKLSEFSL